MAVVKHRQFTVYVVGSIVAWAACCAATTVSPHWEALLRNNPFGDATQPEPPKLEPVTQLELRGVLVEGGKYWFSVYDVGTKRETWVQQDDRVASAQVKDFDQSRDVLTLESQGKRMALALKQPKIIALPESVRGPAVLASIGSPAAPAVAPPLPAAETQRLEQVAAQIRQRREQRIKQTEPAAFTKV